MPSASLSNTQTSTVSSLSNLPSIGAPLRPWGVSQKGRIYRSTNDKVNLWSAVALQSHFGTSGGAARRARGGNAPSSSTARPPDEITAEPVVVEDDGLNTAALPPPQKNGRLTLAQKMGLVPLPPPPPTEDDWRAVEQRALLRDGLEKVDGRVCGICFESFYSTVEQGQVILSCSHVFHERCFAQFERFTRRQQREDGTAGLHLLACPECRKTHYHKRTFFAGKALTQRAAIVKIQAAYRGFQARKAYTAMRLRSNSEFRDHYVQERLAKLSQAWAAYMDQASRERETVLLALQTQTEEARAGYLTEEEWQAIIRKRVAEDKEAFKQQIMAQETAPHLQQQQQRGGQAGGRVCVHQCPICLEKLERNYRPSDTLAPLPPVAVVPDEEEEEEEENEEEASDSGASRGEGEEPVPGCGDEYVAKLRQEYEEKRRLKEREKRREAKRKAKESSREAKAAQSYKFYRPHLSEEERAERFHRYHRYKPVKRAENPASQKGGGKSSPAITEKEHNGTGDGGATPAGTTPSAQPRVSCVSSASAQALESSMIRPDVGAPLPRYATILSCGHCFHDACLQTFERYSQWRHLKADCGIVSHRCPICRSGYKKHHF